MISVCACVHVCTRMADACICESNGGDQMAWKMNTAQPHTLTSIPTLSRRRLDSAIRSACHLQQELLALPWPQELLQLEECGWESEQRQLFWGGERLSVKGAAQCLYALSARLGR